MTQVLFVIVVVLFNLAVGFSVAVYLGRGPREWQVGRAQQPAPVRPDVDDIYSS